MWEVFGQNGRGGGKAPLVSVLGDLRIKVVHEARDGGGVDGAWKDDPPSLGEPPHAIGARGVQRSQGTGRGRGVGHPEETGEKGREGVQLPARARRGRGGALCRRPRRRRAACGELLSRHAARGVG